MGAPVRRGRHRVVIGMVAALTVASLATGLASLPGHSQAIAATSLGEAPRDIGLQAGSGQVRVTWADPQYSPNYIAQVKVDAQPGPASCTAALGVNECTVTGLTNGTAYTFAVYAVGLRGWNFDPAIAGPAWPCCSLPEPPARVSAEASTGAAVVSWDPPSNAFAAGSDFVYSVSSDPPGGSCETSTRSCRIEGLQDGTGYTFQVSASGRAGRGTPGSSPQVTPLGPPGAPTDAQVFLGDRGTATVSWLGPVKTGGAVVDRYVAVASPGGASCTSTGQLSCTVRGLANGQRYRFAVTAYNEFGAGPQSQWSKVARPLAGPGVVGQPRASLVGSTVVRVVWDAPRSTGGLPIDGYTVKSSPGGSQCRTTKTTTCTIRGLAAGRRYVFTIQARNAKGSGLVAQTNTVTTPAPPAPVPVPVPTPTDKPEAPIN